MKKDKKVVRVEDMTAEDLPPISAALKKRLIKARGEQEDLKPSYELLNERANRLERDLETANEAIDVLRRSYSPVHPCFAEINALRGRIRAIETAESRMISGIVQRLEALEHPPSLWSRLCTYVVDRWS